MLEVVVERRDLMPLPYRQRFGGSELPNPIDQVAFQVTQFMGFNSMVEVATDYDMSGPGVGIDLGKGAVPEIEEPRFAGHGATYSDEVA